MPYLPLKVVWISTSVRFSSETYHAVSDAARTWVGILMRDLDFVVACCGLSVIQLCCISAHPLLNQSSLASESHRKYEGVLEK